MFVFEKSDENNATEKRTCISYVTINAVFLFHCLIVSFFKNTEEISRPALQTLYLKVSHRGSKSFEELNNLVIFYQE